MQNIAKSRGFWIKLGQQRLPYNQTRVPQPSSILGCCSSMQYLDLCFSMRHVYIILASTAMADILSRSLETDRDNVGSSLHHYRAYLAPTSNLLFMHIGRLDLLPGRHGIQSIESDIDTRTGEVLSSIHKPLENGDDDDNSKCCNTVIYIGRLVNILS
jgi:hypothetical protein